MVDRPDPQTIATWLEWAAIRLIAMPAGRLKPAEPRALWPDYVREVLPGTSDIQINKIRALAPSSAEIPIVDEVMVLPNLCDSQDVRRVLHFRAQIHPIRRTHLHTWIWIARKLDVKIHTAKRWHRDGLREVARKVPSDIVCRIMTFMNNT